MSASKGFSERSVIAAERGASNAEDLHIVDASSRIERSPDE